MKWLNNATNEIEMRKEAIVCKESILANMIVYYMIDGRLVIQMISIDRSKLEDAKRRMEER